MRTARKITFSCLYLEMLSVLHLVLKQSLSIYSKYVNADLQEFAGEGLRTLALAYKDLDEEYFSQWKQRHHEASTSLEEKEGKLDELYEEIEKDLLVRS